MKKKYIVPKVEFTFCHLEHALLAGSDPSKDPKSQLPDENPTDIPEEKGDLDMGAKGFTAWESWDE